MKLFISIDTDTEHFPDAVGRSILKSDIKTQSKSHPGKSKNIASLFWLIYLFQSLSLSLIIVPVCCYYRIQYLHKFPSKVRTAGSPAVIINGKLVTYFKFQSSFF